VLLEEGSIAESSLCALLGFLAGQVFFAHNLLDFFFEVRAHLLCKLVVKALATEDAWEPFHNVVSGVGGLVSWTEHERDALEHALEAGDFFFKMAQAGSSDGVGADAAVGRGDGPLGLDQLVFQESLQGRVERTFFDLKEIVRALLDVLDQCVSMSGLTAERLEDHHFECSGKEVAGSVLIILHKACS
jgi:hypothetical protein